MYVIAWDDDPENPNPHELNVQEIGQDTYEEAVELAEEQRDGDDASYVIVWLNPERIVVTRNPSDDGT